LLAGRLLRARRGVRWIADFRDPLADTPGLDALFNGRQRSIARWLEKKTMESADHVVANTDASGQELCRKYPHCGGKVTVIWNGFDPQMRLSPLALPDRPFKLVSHVGDLYLGRNVTPLLEAIGRLIDRGRLSASGIRVRLVGFAEHGSLPQPEFLERASAAGWMDLRAARVPREEAEQTSLTSDGLLLVQPHSAIQVPGKLFEYLQIGRPILAYILPASPAERILEGGGVRYTAIYPGSSQATVEDRVEEFFKQPFETVAPSAWFEEQFNAERQTAALDRLIRTIHSR
jgi:glycosyltransferase involved in cell wall biosynthesis